MFCAPRTEAGPSHTGSLRSSPPQCRRGPPNGSTTKSHNTTLDKVGFGALGLVLDVAGSAHRRLHDRIRDLAQTPGANVEFGVGWDELRAVAGRIQGLLSNATALLPAH